MSWIDPLRRLLRPVEVRQAEPRPQPEEPEPAPLAWGLVAQSARILSAAHRYRQQIRREAEVRAQHEQERERRAQEQRQLAWEDQVARSLAARWSHFPGDDSEAREPGPQLLTLDEWARSGHVDIWERR